MLQGLHNPTVALSLQMSTKTDKEDAYHEDIDVELSPTAVVVDRSRTSMFTYLYMYLFLQSMHNISVSACSIIESNRLLLVLFVL